MAEKANAGAAKPSAAKGAVAQKTAPKTPKAPAVEPGRTHHEVARDIRGQHSLEQEDRARDKRLLEVSKMVDDDSDVMFAPGRSDLLCGVVREQGWRYLICTEDTASQGKSRPNLAKFRGAGYEIAPLPDHLRTEENKGLADWPEISKAILRVPMKRWLRYRAWFEKELLEANGASIDQAVEDKVTEEGPYKFTENHAIDMVGPADLGIKKPGAASGDDD